MERLPAELYLKIFCLLDHQNLATAHLVCRKWRNLSSENILWSNLFRERWGSDCATFYAPLDSKTWKDVYVVQHRCDRFGLGLKIIREGDDYYLVHQGEIQRYLGRRRPETGEIDPSAEGCKNHDCLGGDEPCSDIMEMLQQHLLVYSKSKPITSAVFPTFRQKDTPFA